VLGLGTSAVAAPTDDHRRYGANAVLRNETIRRVNFGRALHSRNSMFLEDLEDDDSTSQAIFACCGGVGLPPSALLAVTSYLIARHGA
jgi:hypothetical protein